MHQKHYHLSAEKRRYLGHLVVIADRSCRKCYSDKHFVDCQTCSMRTSHSMQTSNHPVEAESVVEAGSDLVKQKGSRQTVETAEIAEPVDRTAHMLSAQALIFLVEAPAAHSDCTGIVKFGTGSLNHSVKLDSAAVLQMVDLQVATLELVWVLEEVRSSEVETRNPVAEVLVEVQLLVQSENAEVAAPEFRHLLDHYQHPHLPWYRLDPCFRIEPLPDQLHASLALPQLLAAPEFFVGNSLSVQPFLLLCTHSWQSRQVEAAILTVAGMNEEE